MEKVKKAAAIILIIILLALDYATLDDITTGNEPNYTGEYLFLAFSIIVIGTLIYIYFKRK